MYRGIDSYFTFFDNFLENGSIGLVLGCVIGACVSIALPTKKEIVKTTYILESLQDNSSVQGSFFLGIGNNDGTMKYVFYYKTDGFYKMNQIDYNKTKIKYSTDIPKIEQYSTVKVKSAILNYFAYDFFWTRCDKEYIIYIPEGTIKQSYSLDAQ
jgi:hypothetical protein